MGKALRHCESGGLRSRCMLAVPAGPRLVAPLQRRQFSLQRRQQRQSIPQVAASGALESTRTSVLMLPSPSSSSTVCTERRAPGGQPRVWACADGRWATRADRLHLDVLDLFVAQVMVVEREAILELRRGDEACAVPPTASQPGAPGVCNCPTHARGAGETARAHRRHRCRWTGPGRPGD